MGFRFSRRIKLLPGVSLNLSKSGISTSFGVKGFRVNIGPRGTRTTVSIPGTGLSYSTYQAHKTSEAPPAPQDSREPGAISWSAIALVMFGLLIVLGLAGGLKF